MGFIINQLFIKANNLDENIDHSVEDTDEEVDADATITQAVTQPPPKETPSAAQPIQWIEGVGQVTDLSDNPHYPSSSPTTPTAYVDVLSERATQFFLDFVLASTQAISESKSSEGGSDLYQKYKNKMVGNDNVTVDVMEVVEMALSRFIPPMAEIFGPSLKGRQMLKVRGIECTLSLRNFPSPQVKMVYQLANTIDEEIIVLHLSQNKGYRLYITGCSDNKILGIAIAAALIAPEGDSSSVLLPGKRPPDSIINLLKAGNPQTLSDNTQWAHPFTFSNWTCIKPDGTSPSGMSGASHWIWPDGSPTEICKWKDQRILVLGQAPFPRKFDPVRVFEGLNAEGKVLSVLTQEEIKGLVRLIATTDDQVREEAVKNHKKYQ